MNQEFNLLIQTYLKQFIPFRLVKLNIKMYQAIQALAAFTKNDIVFDNSKFKQLWDKRAESDNDEFYIEPPDEVYDRRKLLEDLQSGVKVYFFKEKDEDNEYHRLKQRR